ncbi:MAG: selenocysteine-specific translation elongation factor [Armatimonadota bacterium]
MMRAESGEKHLILGTAGHVDHGKTTLIKAMTGIDTDRLKEERERGLTIDLGFAWLNLPSGALIGIVDVPGHERFLKNMLAGASGVDIALLVVAADEGVMPQTREHVEILELLETRNGVVALTKCDAVEPDWLDLVEQDVRDYLAHTFLRHAKIVRVSGTTGEGVAELIEEIDRLARQVQQRATDGPFRLPVDRVFTMTGFGTVVTGTLVSGTLRVGDPITILPEDIDSRVRQIQVHGTRRDTAYAGSRVAVNLAGVEVEELARGSVIVPPGYLQPTRAVDASVTVLPDSPRPLTNQTRIRLHIGTAEAIGRAIVLGADDIRPGSKGMAQMRLEKPIVAARGDRFVLRFYSPMRVLGGGVVLDPTAPKHRRWDRSVIERLERALDGNPEEIVLDALVASETGLVRNQVTQKTGLSDVEADRALKCLLDAGRAVEHQGRFVARSSYESLAARIRSALEAYHAANAARPGAPREEIRALFGPRMDQRGFQTILALMAERGEVAVSETILKLPGHVPSLSERQKELMSGIEAVYREAGANPPLLSQIGREYGAEGREAVALLVEKGDLVRITPELLFHAQVLAQIESALRGYLQEHGQITVWQFRDLIGSSRKYVVPLVEYFDSKRVTRRLGDQRVLAR